MIELLNLSHSFSRPDGGVEKVLDFDSLTIASAERVAVVGASGSGKSTLLNIIAGLMTPTTGKVIISGVDIASWTESRRDQFRAQHIGVVFQSHYLLDGFSLLENVELGALFADGQAAGGRSAELLERVGLGDKLHALPNQISVGQRARVALARSLATSPNLLLADEPCGSLDEVTSQRVLELMFQCAQEDGITLLCATHDRNVARRFDRVVSVEDLR